MRRVIVDGYNVINSDEALSRLQQQSLDAARHGLIIRLCQAQRLRYDEVTVVFDGWRTGAGHQSTARMHGVRVVFSPRGERADEVIKRLVQTASDPSAVVVVSNDRELRVQCDQGGAQGSGSENLMRQATPARRPRQPPSVIKAKDEDDEDTSRRRDVSPSKKGPARRLPKNQRQSKPPDYRF